MLCFLPMIYTKNPIRCIKVVRLTPCSGSVVARAVNWTVPFGYHVRQSGGEINKEWCVSRIGLKYTGEPV